MVTDDGQVQNDVFQPITWQVTADYDYELYSPRKMTDKQNDEEKSDIHHQKIRSTLLLEFGNT